MRDKHAPIFSSREDEPELREPISEFVVGLAERIDRLQDVEQSGDLQALRALSAPLAEEARQLGYASLVDLAQELCRACDEDKPEMAQAALLRVTQLGRRIRLGHRGAAG